MITTTNHQIGAPTPISTLRLPMPAKELTLTTINIEKECYNLLIILMIMLQILMQTGTHTTRRIQRRDSKMHRSITSRSRQGESKGGSGLTMRSRGTGRISLFKQSNFQIKRIIATPCKDLSLHNGIIQKQSVGWRKAKRIRQSI